MNDIYGRLLYQDSPFLPSFDTKIAEKIKVNISEDIHPALVIAFYLGEINSSIRQLFREEFGWIKSTFQATSDNLFDFSFGFACPSHFIYGSWSFVARGEEETLSSICVPSAEVTVNRFNKYKALHIPNLSKYFEPFISDPIITAAPIFSYCRIHPYLENDWYLSGIESSERIFRLYADIVNKQSKESLCLPI